MWHLRLFGEVSLCASSAGASPATTDPPRRFRARKYALLLSYLALHAGRAHRRDSLCERFWADSEPEAGRTCLRTALSSLRRVLITGDPEAPSEPFLSEGHDVLRLNPRLLVCDAVLFERLLKRAEAPNRIHAERHALREKAFSLYSGPLLPGADDSWVLGERERFEIIYERAQADHKAGGRGTVSSARPETEPSHLIPAGLPALPPISVRLPTPSSRYFGRESERRQIETWFSEGTRLITITGIGGIGKTRLALEAARDMVAKRRWGFVAFVPLATCADPDLLPEAVSSALTPGTRSKEAAWGAAPMDDLLSLLGEPPAPGLPPSCLLILDNVEQLLSGENGAGAARFARALLTSVPRLCLIVTSRSPLRAEGERELPLMGLADTDAAAFLLDRARSAGRPDWGTATDAALPEIGAVLCGIPLAIELVSSWASVLSPRQICERIVGESATLLESPLTSDRRGLREPTRHRSLRAALEWGYAELPPDVRRVMGGMAGVFRGGATLGSVSAVLTGGDETAALLHIATLRDRSLIGVADDGIETRYHMLEVVREWANERFAADREPLPVLRERHACLFLALASTDSSRAGSLDAAPAFARLESEETNILSALGYALSGEHLPTALDLCRRLRYCWFVRGRNGARAAVNRMLLDAWGTRRAALRRHDPGLYADLADTVAPLLPEGEAHPALQEALSFFEARRAWARCAGICEQLAWRIGSRGGAAVADGWMARGAAFMEHDPDTYGLEVLLANWAGTYTERGEHDKAHPLLVRCWNLARAQGEVRRGNAAKIGLALAEHALRDNDPVTAEQLARESVTVFSERGETWNHAESLKSLGHALAARDGQEVEAREVWTHGHRLYLELGDTWNASVLVEHLRSLLDSVS